MLSSPFTSGLVGDGGGRPVLVIDEYELFIMLFVYNDVAGEENRVGQSHGKWQWLTVDS